MQVCNEAKRCGADIVAVSVICNRGNISAEQLGVPILEAMIHLNLSSVESSECGLCKKRVPIVDNIAHGDKYKKLWPDYKGSFISLL